MGNYLLAFKVMIDGQPRSFRVPGSIKGCADMLQAVVAEHGDKLQYVRLAPAKFARQTSKPNGQPAPRPQVSAKK